MLPPRFGLLAYVVDAYRRGRGEDVVLLPVSIAYDQIQDVGDYVAEQRGAAKERESFRWFLRVVRKMRQRYGRIHINFGEPLPLSEAVGPPHRTPALADERISSCRRSPLRCACASTAPRRSRRHPWWPWRCSACTIAP
jgi:glycerol-3-phosphate O-acyltransferase